MSAATWGIPGSPRSPNILTYLSNNAKKDHAMKKSLQHDFKAPQDHSHITSPPTCKNTAQHLEGCARARDVLVARLVLRGILLRRPQEVVRCPLVGVTEPFLADHVVSTHRTRLATFRDLRNLSGPASVAVLGCGDAAPILLLHRLFQLQQRGARRADREYVLIGLLRRHRCTCTSASSAAGITNLRRRQRLNRCPLRRTRFERSSHRTQPSLTMEPYRLERPLGGPRGYAD